MRESCMLIKKRFIETWNSKNTLKYHKQMYAHIKCFRQLNKETFTKLTFKSHHDSKIRWERHLLIGGKNACSKLGFIKSHPRPGEFKPPVSAIFWSWYKPSVWTRLGILLRTFGLDLQCGSVWVGAFIFKYHHLPDCSFFSFYKGWGRPEQTPTRATWTWKRRSEPSRMDRTITWPAQRLYRVK